MPTGEAFKAFAEEMKRLDDYFRGGKPMPESTLFEYWEICAEIPAEAMGDIGRRVRRAGKAIPSHYPTPDDLISMWHDWQQSNRHRMATEHEVEPCDYCNGTGQILVDRAPPWIPEHCRNHPWAEYRAVVACGHCRNSERTLSKHVKRMKVSEIDRRGWVRVPLDEPIYQPDRVKSREEAVRRAFG